MSAPAGQPVTPKESAVRALQRRKSALEGNLDSLLGQCTTDDQRATLRSAYAEARDQWEQAATMALVTDETQLTAIVAQSNTLQDQLDAAIASTAAIASVVQMVAQGIKIGSQVLKFLKP